MTPAVDLSDTYRGAYAFGVGALDNYVHNVVREQVMKILSGSRNAPRTAASFRIPSWLHQDLTVITSRSEALLSADRYVQETLGRQTFQKSGDIADAIRLVSSQAFWLTQYGDTNSAKYAKAQLDLIVDRRNKIVHEADIDPSTLEKWPIDNSMVLNALDYIARVADKIELHLELDEPST